ncbi:lipocalin family protein [Fluviispira vulneris]|uniref:lipocalin family protein n=1 Tax=Fluviispira vulneris TaxID=2763012 RepID=UPI00164926BE|nr:lipocalin family protein [Fluviispira vulneris]
MNKYLGTWHEQARLETKFQKNCDSSTAHYSLNNDGTIKVLNTFNRIDGSSNDIIGKAKIDPKDPSGRNLIVSFNFITTFKDYL